MDTARELLRKYWGYSSFLAHQEEIIGSVLSGRDTLAIMATGGGKSLCYQLPAMVLGGLTVVVSPLISLMKDQVDDLNTRGIPAAAWNSSLEYRERNRITDALRSGELRLLFISPEKCMQPNFLGSLSGLPVRLIAIDEAHCISEWGHNFRPEYRQLSQLKKHFPDVPLIALTATAIPAVRTDIIGQLGLSGAQEFVGSFNRENLHYRVIPKKNPLVFLQGYIGQHRDDSGIVYCLAKKETEEIASDLRRRGFSALAYHGGLSKQVRDSVQDAFIRDRVKVVCATVAFGMGIDKPDVRYVVHYDLPKSVESYYQETGRAGRDGQWSECVLLYSRGDYGRIRSMLEHDDPSGSHLRIELGKLREMTEYCETSGCRRKFLLSYFGEEPAGGNCGSCDNCEHPPDMVDCTEAAGLILRCVKELPAQFGTEMVSGILRGSKSARIRESGFDRLTVYGAGKRHSRDQYRAWIGELVRQGFLAKTGDRYPVLALTGKSTGLLLGRIRVMLPLTEPAVRERFRRHEVGTAGPAEEALFIRLKALRKAVAERNGVPPYVIFPDRSLREMAALRPADPVSFGEISGVGEVKLAKYGPEFIREIRRDLPAGAGAGSGTGD